jgi:anti-anti-sigma factor
MKFAVQSSDAGVTRLECSGRITHADAKSAANPLLELVGPNAFAGKVLLDLSKVDYVDSAGVGWFIESNKQFQKSGGKLVLHSIPPLVSHIFRLLQMHTVLNLADDEAAALAAVQGGQP